MPKVSVCGVLEKALDHYSLRTGEKPYVYHLCVPHSRCDDCDIKAMRRFSKLSLVTRERCIICSYHDWLIKTKSVDELSIKGFVGKQEEMVSEQND